MNRAVRTSLRLFVSIMLLSAVALAHASGNKVDKNTNREHPSRFSKIAFWRRHKDRGKTGGNLARVHQNKKTGHHSRMSRLAFWRHHKGGDGVKTARANHAPVNNTQAKAAQPKPVPRPLATGNKGHKQEGLGGGTPAKAPSTANKSKPQQAAHDRTTASLQQ